MEFVHRKSKNKGCIMKPALHYALRLIAWRPRTCVFPVLYDDKSQPLLKDYLNRASNDPAQVREWFQFWGMRTGHEPWYGIAPARSGLVFADVDTKRHKRGAQTFDNLELDYGWPDTFESSSPSGGRHLWYEGAALFAVGRADTNHPDIDFAQYIIGSGCRRADGTGYHVAKKRPIAAAPSWFYSVAKKIVREASVNQTPVVELDLPSNVAWAIHWLQEDAPACIEGQGGDDTLVKKVVPPLKDMGISLELACELVAEHYNSRCLPPWQLGDCDDRDNLFVKIANGYRYFTQRAPGEGTPQYDFAHDPPEPLTDEDRKWALIEEARRARRRARELADTTVPPLLKHKDSRP
jgi:Bifunctional DNA primase/polymerase, N-terminal